MNDENIKKMIVVVLSNLREQIPVWRRSNSVYTDEDEEAIVGIDKDPIEAYKEYKQNRIDKVLEIDSFNQFYDKDDNQFVFGNPKIFKT